MLAGDVDRVKRREYLTDTDALRYMLRNKLLPSDMSLGNAKKLLQKARRLEQQEELEEN